jgi:TRAP-type C4-dicarboxylate transport system permease large subunit
MLFLGMLLETSAILIILIPILMPLIIEVGIDPIHFGVIAVINLLMGGITPPLGILMFTTCGICNVSTRDFIKEIWIFYIPLLLLLLTVTFFPALSLWLPNLLFR